MKIKQVIWHCFLKQKKNSIRKKYKLLYAHLWLIIMKLLLMRHQTSASPAVAVAVAVAVALVATLKSNCFFNGIVMAHIATLQFADVVKSYGFLKFITIFCWFIRIVVNCKFEYQPPTLSLVLTHLYTRL